MTDLVNVLLWFGMFAVPMGDRRRHATFWTQAWVGQSLPIRRSLAGARLPKVALGRRGRLTHDELGRELDVVGVHPLAGGQPQGCADGDGAHLAQGLANRGERWCG